MDELEGLRTYRGRATAPSAESIDRIRRRFESAIQDEARQHVHGQPPWIRRSGAAVLAAIVLVAGIAIYGQVAGTGAPATPSQGTWRVAGFISGFSWQQNIQGPTPGQLTCPTASTCYVADTQANGTGTDSGSGQLLGTTDGGSHWGSTPLPIGMNLTTALQCTDENTCLAGADTAEPAGSSTPVLAKTNDGGHTWDSKPLPDGVGSLYALSCPSASTCSGLASTSSVTHSSSKFVMTSNAGISWIQHAFPEEQIERSLSCATVAACVVVGNEPSTSGGVPGTGTVWQTADGGHTWLSGSLPANVASVDNTTCPVATNCTAIAAEIVPDPNCVTATTMSAPTTPDLCSPTRTVLVSEPVVSSDSGATWKLHQFPTGMAHSIAFALSCPTAKDCWVAGADGTPNKATIGGVPTNNAGSPAVFATDDGGSTWTSDSLPAPTVANAGEIPSGIGQIKCATTTACVALGTSLQGSQSTIVYSYRTQPL